MNFGQNIVLSIFTVTFLCHFTNGENSNVESSKCHPPTNSSAQQFMIGYGSLMNEKSKLKTDSTVGETFPVIVSGFERLWNARGSKNRIQTYLGIKPNPSSSFNAIIFELPNDGQKALTAFDTREYLYCRVSVDPSQVKHLASPKHGNSDPKQSQYWIYVTKPSDSALPDKDHPITLKYVDTYISGCLKLEDKFNLENFGLQCVNTTKAWPATDHWLNNREDRFGVTAATNVTSNELWPRIDRTLINGLHGKISSTEYEKLISNGGTIKHIPSFMSLLPIYTIFRIL